MPEGLGVVVDIGMFTVVGAAFISWVAISVYAIKTVRRALPGVAIWGRTTLWNPFNLLLMPGLLTEDGRSCRRKCFLATAIFFGSVAAMAAMSLIAK